MTHATTATHSAPEADDLAVARVLAAAFVSNPLNLAVVGSSEKRRYRSNLVGMRSMLAAARGQARRGLELGPEGEVRAALVGVLPGRFPFPDPPLASQLLAVAVQGFGVASRWARVYERLLAEHPSDPHHYLTVLGVDPAHQRQGLGSRLLRQWLEFVDAEAMPSYLETDREANVAFYASAGFEVVQEIFVLGVPVWCMWRTARPGAGEREGEADVRTPQ